MMEIALRARRIYAECRRLRLEKGLTVQQVANAREVSRCAYATAELGLTGHGQRADRAEEWLAVIRSLPANPKAAKAEKQRLSAGIHFDTRTGIVSTDTPEEMREFLKDSPLIQMIRSQVIHFWHNDAFDAGMEIENVDPNGEASIANAKLAAKRDALYACIGELEAALQEWEETGKFDAIAHYAIAAGAGAAAAGTEAGDGA